MPTPAADGRPHRALLDRLWPDDRPGPTGMEWLGDHLARARLERLAHLADLAPMRVGDVGAMPIGVGASVDRRAELLLDTLASLGDDEVASTSAGAKRLGAEWAPGRDLGPLIERAVRELTVADRHPASVVGRSRTVPMELLAALPDEMVRSATDWIGAGLPESRAGDDSSSGSLVCHECDCCTDALTGEAIASTYEGSNWDWQCCCYLTWPNLYRKHFSSSKNHCADSAGLVGVTLGEAERGSAAFWFEYNPDTDSCDKYIVCNEPGGNPKKDGSEPIIDGNLTCAQLVALEEGPMP